MLDHCMIPGYTGACSSSAAHLQISRNVCRELKAKLLSLVWLFLNLTLAMEASSDPFSRLQGWQSPLEIAGAAELQKLKAADRQRFRRRLCMESFHPI